MTLEREQAKISFRPRSRGACYMYYTYGVGMSNGQSSLLRNSDSSDNNGNSSSNNWCLLKETKGERERERGSEWMVELWYTTAVMRPRARILHILNSKVVAVAALHTRSVYCTFLEHQMNPTILRYL